MKRQHAEDLGRLIQLIGDWVRLNIFELIELANEDEVCDLRNAEQEKAAAKRDAKSGQKVSEVDRDSTGTKGTKKTRKTARTDPMAAYCGASPSSCFMFWLERDEPYFLEYIRAESNDLVLSEKEIRNLANLVEVLPPFGTSVKWKPWEAPHQWLSDRIIELTSVLGVAAIQPLRECGKTFTRLRDDGVALHEGLELCADVVACITRMLQAANRLAFVPAPDGIWRTPSTKDLKEPPEELAVLVARIRKVLDEHPAAKKWSSNKLLDHHKPPIKGKYQTLLIARQFLISTGEITGPTDDT